jgi:hypothetical protein
LVHLIHNAENAADHPNTSVRARHRLHRLDGRGIIGIDADIDAIIVMIEAAERGSQHLADHRRFVPCTNEQRDSAWIVGCSQAARMNRFVTTVYCDTSPEGSNHPDHIDGQIIDAADQQTDCGKQHQFVRGSVQQPQRRRHALHDFPPIRYD